MVLTMHFCVAPRLKKEKSYTSTPSLGLHGLFEGELYFTLPYFVVYFLKSFDRYCAVIFKV